MGFGLLFFGYLFFCNFAVATNDASMVFDVFPDIIGWILMLVALLKLSPYSDKLKAARIPAIIMIPLSLYSLLTGFALLGFLGSAGEAVFNAVTYATYVILPVYLWFICFGIRDILADCAGNEKTAAALKVTFWVSLCYSVAAIFNKAMRGFSIIQNQKILAITDSAVQLLSAVWLLTGAFAILKTFMNITLSDKKN